MNHLAMTFIINIRLTFEIVKNKRSSFFNLTITSFFRLVKYLGVRPEPTQVEQSAFDQPEKLVKVKWSSLFFPFVSNEE